MHSRDQGIHLLQHVPRCSAFTAALPTLLHRCYLIVATHLVLAYPGMGRVLARHSCRRCVERPGVTAPCGTSLLRQLAARMLRGSTHVDELLCLSQPQAVPVSAWGFVESRDAGEACSSRLGGMGWLIYASWQHGSTFQVILATKVESFECL